MDVQNEWNRARKVITESEFVRVSSSAVASLSVGDAKCKTLREIVSGRVNALEAFSRDSRKRMLNAVVEVKYTTSRLEVTG